MMNILEIPTLVAYQPHVDIASPVLAVKWDSPEALDSLAALTV